MTKKIVVDIGAGPAPDKRATDAIDVLDKQFVAKVRRRLPKKHRGKDLRKIDYYYGRSMTKKGAIPTELKGKADLIISNNALAATPEMSTKVTVISANIDALAKPNAKIEILVGYRDAKDKREELRTVRQVLRGAHFSSPTIKDNKRTGELRIKSGRLMDSGGRVHKQRRGSVI